MGRTKRSNSNSTPRNNARNTNSKDNKKIPIKEAAFVAIIALLLGSRFPGLGNGLGIIPGGQDGQGTGSGNTVIETGASSNEETISESVESEVDSSEAVVTTEALTTVEDYTVIEVTVNEDGYLYQNQKCELGEIIEQLSEGDEIRLTIRRASKNDVDDLMEAAAEKGIRIVREN